MNKTYMLGRKKIGERIGDTFYKEVYRSKGHLFFALDAWGIDSKTLRELPDDIKIVINDLERNAIYRTTKQEYIDKGQYYHFKNEKVDNRKQLFLSRKWFQVEKPKKLEGEELEKHNYMVSQGLA